METPLTVFYTCDLRGDLDVLPRMHAFLRQLKALYGEDAVRVCADDPAPPGGRFLLLDIGDSCAPDVWHCDASGGRSMPVAFDGMGYHAVNVGGFFAPDAREKIGATVQIALVDDNHPAEIDGIWLATGAKSGASHAAGLHIRLAPAESTQMKNGMLSLARVGGRQIGVAKLTPIAGAWTLTAHDIHDLPARVLPDPTIAGIVDFVKSDARYAQKRRDGGT